MRGKSKTQKIINSHLLNFLTNNKKNKWHYKYNEAKKEAEKKTPNAKKKVEKTHKIKKKKLLNRGL